MSSSPWAPVDACTLPAAEQPLRTAEFDDLFAAALREVDWPRSGGLAARLTLAGDPSLPERVQRLADAESSCCSFFTFTVSAPDPVAGRATTVTLDIEVPSAYAEVLAALVVRARATIAGTP